MWTHWLQLFYYALALKSLQHAWINSHLIHCNGEELLLIKGNKKKNKCYSLSTHELSYILFFLQWLKETWKIEDNLQASVISVEFVHYAKVWY